MQQAEFDRELIAAVERGIDMEPAERIREVRACFDAALDRVATDPLGFALTVHSIGYGSLLTIASLIAARSAVHGETVFTALAHCRKSLDLLVELSEALAAEELARLASPSDLVQ